MKIAAATAVAAAAAGSHMAAVMPRCAVRLPASAWAPPALAGALGRGFTTVRDPGGGDAGHPGPAPHRGRLNRAIKESLRDLGAQLSLLNHSVGTRLDLKATDLECLDLVTRDGPLSPGTLARCAGLHPAKSRHREKSRQRHPRSNP